jgi:hypothetical protein
MFHKMELRRVDYHLWEQEVESLCEELVGYGDDGATKVSAG